MQGIKNLTHGPINRQLFNLAMPIMATSFIQMAYSLTDMAWVGRLGSEAVAAIGSCLLYTSNSPLVGQNAMANNIPSNKLPHEPFSFSVFSVAENPNLGNCNLSPNSINSPINIKAGASSSSPHSLIPFCMANISAPFRSIAISIAPNAE